MNLRTWNYMTENQQREIIRRNKLALAEILNIDLTKSYGIDSIYPKIILSDKLTKGEWIKCK